MKLLLPLLFIAFLNIGSAYAVNCSSLKNKTAFEYRNCLKKLSNWKPFQEELDRLKIRQNNKVTKKKENLANTKNDFIHNVKKTKVGQKEVLNLENQQFHLTLADMNNQLRGMKRLLRRRVLRNSLRINATLKKEVSRLKSELRTNEIDKDQYQSFLFDQEIILSTKYNEIESDIQFLRGYFSSQSKLIFEKLELDVSIESIINLFDNVENFVLRRKTAGLSLVTNARRIDEGHLNLPFEEQLLEKLSDFEFIILNESKEYKDLFKYRLYFQEVDKFCEQNELAFCEGKLIWQDAIARSSQIISNIPMDELNNLINKSKSRHKEELRKVLKQGDIDAFFLAL
jgi:hypothetical protein